MDITDKSKPSFIPMMEAQLKRRILNRFQDEARELLEKVVAEELANFSIDLTEFYEPITDSNSVGIRFFRKDADDLKGASK